MDIPDRIQRAAERLRQGLKVNRFTVRDFLGHFGAERRGAAKVEAIQNILDSLELETEPNFRSAWIDEPIRLRLKTNASSEERVSLSASKPIDDFESVGPDEIILDSTPSSVTDALEQAEAALTSAEPSTLSPFGEGAFNDPTFRIGILPAANKNPLMVGQDDTLTKAVTMMLQHDFSQLPVMQGEREVKGVISWKSISSRLALSSSIESRFVQDYREDAKIVEANRTLFDVIPLIAEAGYVLVRHHDRKIKGPVTISDLSLHLQALTEPFLCLREIELHVRTLIGSKVDSDDLSVLAEVPVNSRKPKGITDLSFGEYVRLLQNPKTWEKVELQIDKGELTKLLDEVRLIRNDVMHFDPDPMTPDELGTLKRALRFMQDLYELSRGLQSVKRV
jgi:CBS domain-containing protein